MADMIETGLTWLSEQLTTHVARSVTYERFGADAGSVTVTATLSRMPARLSDEPGRTQIQWSDRDYLIPWEDLVINGDQITPRKGDRITDDGEVYEVQPPDTGEPCFQRSDPYGIRLRIHTRQVT